ncbi:excinuclease ABC subunit UvrA [Botrimarina mediterranea]|nr:excinuclease ABC subunit UvrA [Botrimarina mediterranea]
MIDALDDTPTTGSPMRDVAGSRTNGALTGGAIRIRGARVHNLRSVDVDIPRNKLVVITGVSGSGKSSLAFDTLLAEGQRQYIDSLSVYARQFFQQRERPDVDRIDGLQPAVAVDQSQGSHSPRSTVGTITEVHDYLRLLFARAGSMACPECDQPITQQSSSEIEQAVAALPVDSRAMLLAPLIHGRKGKHAEVIETARKAGFVRLRIDGLAYPIEDVPELTAQKLHDIEAVVDRIVIREGIDTRLAESVRLAIKHGDGVVRIVYQTPEAKAAAATSGANGAAAYNAQSGWEERLFNTRYACPDCKVGVAEVEPRTFSFNSPYGACPGCDGMGVVEAFDPELVVPDLSKSLAEGAVAPWRSATDAGRKKRFDIVEPLLTSLKVTIDTPLADWPRGGVQKLLTGDGKSFAGVLLHLEEERLATKKDDARGKLDAFRDAIRCPDCEGTRLRPEGRACRIADQRIFDVGAMPISEATQWFAGLVDGAAFEADRLPIAEPLVREIHRRLAFLDKAGVGYLTLERSADTLSGGELQRVRLATGVGSGLVGVMYLLDEPSIGLHPRDNDRLLDAIRDLRRQGNTVIVVEHDEEVIRAADWVIDIGPGAGARGGYLVAEGTPTDIAACAESVTGRYLSGAERIATPTERRITTRLNGKAVATCPEPTLALRGATLHNLRGDDFELPLGKLVCVSGVSGSGKTSLVVGTLARALARKLSGAGAKPGPHTALEGVEHLDRFVEIDQSPIGRSPRSNAATYTGVFDEVRKLLAKTKLSRQRGYKPSRFSFNVQGGRCDECQGQGQRKIEMNFLPDLYVTCDACRGARFNRATLAVRYKGLTVADLLTRPLEEVLPLFTETPAIHAPLEALVAVGLGYLSLGQPANTLSGGEAQRVKLAAELGGSSKGGVPARTLYLLDEPTTGLHADDVRRLLGVLGRLVDAGATVLVIEHHLDVMRVADWIIDLGPDGGAGGGRIVAAGTPEHVAAKGTGPTSEWLGRALGG